MASGTGAVASTDAPAPDETDDAPDDGPVTVTVPEDPHATIAGLRARTNAQTEMRVTDRMTPG
ncbi:hypothetical protein GCM10027572_23620 [Flexivirga lutea]